MFDLKNESKGGDLYNNAVENSKRTCILTESSVENVKKYVFFICSGC